VRWLPEAALNSQAHRPILEEPLSRECSPGESRNDGKRALDAPCTRYWKISSRSIVSGWQRPNLAFLSRIASAAKIEFLRPEIDITSPSLRPGRITWPRYIDRDRARCDSRDRSRSIGEQRQSWRWHFSLGADSVMHVGQEGVDLRCRANFSSRSSAIE